jgi:hypothetical protein
MPESWSTIRNHQQFFSTKVEGGVQQSASIRTVDWVRTTSTCTPSLIRCPIPRTWAQYTYLVPDPEDKTRAPGAPPLGQCASQKDAQGETFFEIEKTTCGGTRVFDSNRGLVIDSITLTVSPADIQNIMRDYAQQWTTTISPEAGGFGFAQIFPNWAPVLPPAINCICESSYDASSEYGVTVPIEAITPPPILAPDIESRGSSAIVALMRVYTDQTFSVPVNPGQPIPQSTERFFVEVSTQFLGNNIDIAMCEAARTPSDFSNPSFLLPIYYNDFCKRQIFEVVDHVRPLGADHLARVSMKKFFFVGANTVYVRCRVRACAQRPCGTCTLGESAQSMNPETAPKQVRRNLQFQKLFGRKEAQKRGLQTFVDDPQEGDAFTNMVKITMDAASPTGLAWGEEWKNAKEPWLKGSRVVNGTMVSPFDSLRTTSGVPDVLKVVWSAPPTPVTEEVQGVLSARMVLTGLSANWGTKNIESVADAFKRTLEMGEHDQVIVLGVSEVKAGNLLGVTKATSGYGRALSTTAPSEEHFVRQLLTEEDVQRRVNERNGRTYAHGVEWTRKQRAPASKIMGAFMDRRTRVSAAKQSRRSLKSKPLWFGRQESDQLREEERQVFTFQKDGESDTLQRALLEDRRMWTESNSHSSTRGRRQRMLTPEQAATVAAERATAAAKRKLSDIQRTQFNLELRMRDGSKLTLTQTRMSLLALGSPRITKAFVDKLDEELESRGEQTVNLDTDRVGLSEPVVVLSPLAEFVGTVAPMTFAPGAYTYTGTLPPGTAFVAPPGTPIIVKNSTLEREIIYRNGKGGKSFFTPPILIGGGCVLGVMFLAVMGTFFLHLRRARQPVLPDHYDEHHRPSQSSVTIDLGKDRTLTIQNDELKARDIVNYLKGLRFRRMDSTMSTVDTDGQGGGTRSDLDSDGRMKYATGAEGGVQLDGINEEQDTLSTTESNPTQAQPQRSKFREWLNGSRQAGRVRDNSPGLASGSASEPPGTESEFYSNPAGSQEMQAYSMSRGRTDVSSQVSSDVTSQSSRGRSRSPGEKVADLRDKH